MARILVVQPDPDLAKRIVTHLRVRDCHVERRVDGDAAVHAVLSESYDGIVLENVLPMQDGFKVLDDLRTAGSSAPALMLGDLSDADEPIAKLRADGDAYLVKPFTLSELHHRLDALLHRQRCEATEPVIRAGDLTLDLSAGEVACGGRRTKISASQSRLLGLMMRRAGQRLDRRTIYESVWQLYFDPGAHLIQAHIEGLRRRLEPIGASARLIIEPGVGYGVRDDGNNVRTTNGRTI